jgi:DNA-binding XRE family transcriptional regulator
MNLRLNDMSFSVRIVSPHHRKKRRAILLMLYRTIKEQVRELTLCELHHDDDPLGTTLSMVWRGLKGADALSRDTPRQNLGYLIRIVRTKIGLTQSEFAKLAGVTQTYVSKIEHGERLPTEKFELFIQKILNPDLIHPALFNQTPQSPESFLRSEATSQSPIH